MDPSDKQVYVWTSFEPDDARRAWACFDQPDLKAPHGFTVLAPDAWMVVSNSGDPVVTRDGSGGRRWQFPDTPPLSTYIPVITAGPFHEIRSERGGYDLGLLCRQSLARFLDRDAEELFELTAQGLAFFGDRFGLPFPQHKYDQVFLPDMGGAMENYGCVTWSDVFVYRTAPTYTEREQRAVVLLHEMAHMWFGDIVTMRWWEDIWLNEAFADWACYWAAQAATKFDNVWSSFLASGKLRGYAADMAPTTHPIRQPVDDVAAAVASFDGITYPKGASVLKQLFVFVGEDACVAGLRGYFAKYAWGNTQLADLMQELELASGRDLAGWTESWLDTAGTDRLSLETSSSGDTVLRARGPEGIPPRPHRLDVGVYDRGDDGRSLVRRRLVSLETKGDTTVVPNVANAALLLVNDDDLTFASVRPDASSLATMLSVRRPAALGGVAGGSGHHRVGHARCGANSAPPTSSVVQLPSWRMNRSKAKSSRTCRWRSKPLMNGLPTRFATACSHRSRRSALSFRPTRRAARSLCEPSPRPPSPTTRSPRCARSSVRTSTSAGAC